MARFVYTLVPSSLNIYVEIETSQLSWRTSLLRPDAILNTYLRCVTLHGKVYIYMIASLGLRRPQNASLITRLEANWSNRIWALWLQTRAIDVKHIVVHLLWFYLRVERLHTHIHAYIFADVHRSASRRRIIKLLSMTLLKDRHILSVCVCIGWVPFSLQQSFCSCHECIPQAPPTG